MKWRTDCIISIKVDAANRPQSDGLEQVNQKIVDATHGVKIGRRLCRYFSDESSPEMVQVARFAARRGGRYCG